jgi:Protein of unknown function (DUF4019)
LTARSRVQKILICALALFIFAFAPSLLWAQGSPEAIAQARNEAEEWLNLIDKGDYRASWIRAASLFKDRVSVDEWEQQVSGVRDSLGDLVSRKFKSAKFVTTLPGAPDGKYVVLQYDSSFAHKKAAIETVTPMMDKDGEWRVSGYYIR